MGGATRFLTLLSTPLPLRPRGCPSILRFTRHRHNLQRHFSPFSLQYHHQYHFHSLSASPRRSITSFSVTSSSSQQQQVRTQTGSSALKDDHFSDSPSWPEWINFVSSPSVSGYYDRSRSDDDEEFVDGVNLTEESVRGIRACLDFARDRPHLLRELTRGDIEVLVENGAPFLFKNSDDSIRKMLVFLSSGNSDVIDDDKAQMIDLMKFIVSFAGNATNPERSSFSNFELLESSTRNLLSELLKLSYTPPEANFANSFQSSFTDGYGEAPRPRGQNIEMKRGDWICPSCNFMNFARNMKCLECDHARPKRQLTGREWECPQCDFVNFGRNIACLRCDCKRPESPPIQSSGLYSGYGVENYPNKTELERKLAANEEKAQRWFSKVSQLDSTSTVSSSIVDEDFPEIMPLRKGVNRFVVSTRKTPLERRLANAQYRGSLGTGVTSTSDVSRTGNAERTPEMLQHESTASKSNSSIGSGEVSRYAESRNSNSSYVPFVPLPADMFAKNPESLGTDEEKAKVDGDGFFSSNTTRQMPTAGGQDLSTKLGDDLQFPELSVSEVKRDYKNKEQEESDRWSKRVAELHDTRDLASAISDDEFPDIMPMRKGENRFVVGKKKDRSLTSPLYKRRAAMEQATSSSFVPFVPFPPDYFAKKGTSQAGGENAAKITSLDASTVGNSDKPLEKVVDSPKPTMLDVHQQQGLESRQFGPGSWDSKPIENNPTASSASTVNEVRSREIVNPELVPPQSRTHQGTGFPEENSRKDVRNMTRSPSQPLESSNFREHWSGKSLEGSAVKEPDPLDMSEEAKAERWFRRAAQIKDISELSQIPDEDFPSIMPMRKGVNRFVVSKRKTPLERRLTSMQYRRNLPTVSSDDVKKRDENN